MNAALQQDEVEALVERALDALSDPLLKSLRVSLETLARRLRGQRFHLAVLGQFKRGKSTLVNALLRRPLLPSGMLPVTAVPTFVSAGPQVRVRVRFLDGSLRAVEPDDLPRYVAEKENPDNRLGVGRVEIEAPAPLLDGLSIVDTPGIGSVHVHNSAATLDVLPECDAALVVLSAEPPLTEAELRFLDDVRTQVPRLFYVFNKIDTLSEDELREALGYVRERLGVEQVYAVSARKGEMGTLETDLATFFRDEMAATLREVTRTRTLRMVAEAGRMVDIQAQALRMPLADLERVEGAFSTLRTRLADEARRVEDGLAADRARLLRQLRDDSRHLAEACRQTVTAEVRSRTEGSQSDLEQMRREAGEAGEQALVAFLDDHGHRFGERAQAAAEAALRPHAARVGALVEEVAAEVSALFGVERLAPQVPEVRLNWRMPQWKTWFGYGHGGLDMMLSEGLLRLRSRKVRVAQMTQALVDEVHRLAVRNGNVLFNTVSELVEHSLTDAMRALVASLEAAAHDAAEALITARTLRSEGELQAAARLAELEGVHEHLKAVQAGAQDPGLAPDP